MAHKKRLLFVVHSMAGGGAEKVLVNLLNRLDPNVYEIKLVSVCGGVYETAIPSYVKYRKIIKTKNKIMSKILVRFVFKMNKKLFAKLFLRGEYDFEIAYLEGNPTRQIAKKKSNAKKIAFIHSDVSKTNPIFEYYKSTEKCLDEYRTYDKVCFVSQSALEGFEKQYGKLNNACVVHNVMDFDDVKKKANEPNEFEYSTKGLKLISVGRLSSEKGYERLISVAKELEDLYDFELWILGTGPNEKKLEKQIVDNQIKSVKLWGFQSNPYSFMKKADMYICPSFYEGYGMSVCEATMLGIPTITTDCGGPREILDNGNLGIIVDNSKDALKLGLVNLLENRTILQHYKLKIANIQETALDNAVQENEDLFTITESREV